MYFFGHRPHQGSEPITHELIANPTTHPNNFVSIRIYLSSIDSSCFRRASLDVLGGPEIPLNSHLPSSIHVCHKELLIGGKTHQEVARTSAEAFICWEIYVGTQWERPKKMVSLNSRGIDVKHSNPPRIRESLL